MNLLEKGGAEVDAKRDHDDCTALHEAAYNGHLEVVKYLLEKGGAEVNVKNGNGRTALDLARTMEIRNLLIKRGNLHRKHRTEFTIKLLNKVL